MQLGAGQVAFVTGGASGIGLALCHELARRGVSVIAADIEAVALERAVAELGDAGHEALGVECDVTSMDSMTAAADEAFAWKGSVDVLANNAGVVAFGDAFSSLDDWKWVIDVDLWGVVHGLHAFVPRMRESGRPGHIVNTASTAGIFGFPNIASYVAAKHAVVGLSQSIWHELAPTALGASVLCPGVVSTNINTSERNRPGTEPGSVELQDDFGENYQETLSAAEVASMVCDAIEADRFWILPQEHYAEQALAIGEGRLDGSPPVMPRIR
ncbi:MAG: SDR family NAD(P)-dependent oxidoreductase [Actinomycetota bacterium]